MRGTCAAVPVERPVKKYMNQPDLFDDLNLMPAIQSRPYRSIDLFAGIGGIRMGFDRAFGKEIETVFVSEWDIPAQKTVSIP